MYSQRSMIQGQRGSHEVVKRLTGAGRRTRIETVCCMKSQAELPIADESSAMILLFVVWPLVSNNTETYPFGGPMSSKDMCDSWGHDDFGPRRRRSLGQPTLSLLRPFKSSRLTHWRSAYSALISGATRGTIASSWADATTSVLCDKGSGN